jgi:hypothetical protein
VHEQGRVACEINTADELLVTELMFNGAFNDLSPQQSVGGFDFPVPLRCALHVYVGIGCAPVFVGLFVYLLCIDSCSCPVSLVLALPWFLCEVCPAPQSPAF